MESAKIRILKSSSYICCLGVADDGHNYLEHLSKEFNSRYFNISVYEDFIELVNQVKIFSAIIIDWSVIKKSNLENSLQWIEGMRYPVFILNCNDEIPYKNVRCLESIFEASNLIKTSLDKLMPSRLAELAIFSADHILEYLTAKRKLKFSEVSTIAKFKAEYTLSCQVQAPNLFGYCFLKINTANIGQLLDEDMTDSEFKLMDFSKEMVNQFWGVICQNIGKLGIYPNVGLPTAHDANGNAGMSKTYIPKVFLADECGIFAFELGFMALDQTVPFDLTGIEFSLDVKNDDEIEML